LARRQPENWLASLIIVPVLAMLTLGVASMLLGMLLRPSILPQGDTRHQDATGWKAWRDWS
jgi:hypothetical protein